MRVTRGNQSAKYSSIAESGDEIPEEAGLLWAIDGV
jgi:hypothetical protein